MSPSQDQLLHVLDVLGEQVAVEPELVLVARDDLGTRLLVVDVVLLQGLDQRLDRVARHQPEEEERDGERAPQLHQVEPEPADAVRRQRVPRQPGAHPGPGVRVPATADRGHRRRLSGHAGPFCPVASILPSTKMKCGHQFSGTSYRSSSVGQPVQNAVLKYDG